MTPRTLIRPYRPGDRPAVYDICVRTGHEGGDARHLFTDLDLLPDNFAGPYAHLEPELAFVADDGMRAVGYIVGTADTAAFVRRFRREWLPRLEHRHPRPSGPLVTADDELADLLHRPERMIVPELADYPAHLHIDLLPEYQGRGHGRELMVRFLSALAGRGVGAVHLGMVTANTAARAFYDRMGFRELPVPDPGALTYLGRDTSPPVAAGG
ncbi:GNAT family N-acetyltransferase [Streptomyces sp. ME01-24h]|nr:GNAT family N-acetyltransferase [Streptomyces sp. ME19-03-3]MDX3357928.1 GNAT family N-acetyltransferase [Streptomyces sp. ME01-24h]